MSECGLSARYKAYNRGPVYSKDDSGAYMEIAVTEGSRCRVRLCYDSKKRVATAQPSRSPLFDQI